MEAIEATEDAADDDDSSDAAADHAAHDPDDGHPTLKPLPSALRTWTSADGFFSTVATLVSIDGEAVLLEKEDGERITVPLSRLCAADVEFATTRPEAANVIRGKVVGISDGDTLTVLDSFDRTHKVRLEGIDSPELKQDFGTKAKQALSSKVFGQYIRVDWEERDRYGRVLGHVYIGDRWINREMVADGFAWHFKKYSSDSTLAAAEEFARAAKVGLWSDPNKPQAPWDFRANPPLIVAAPPIDQPQTLLKPAPAAAVESPDGLPADAYWLNTSSNVRHNRSCRHFGNTKRGRFCTATEGKACGICGG